MTNHHYKKVKKYFTKKAAEYDLVDEQLYWRLSDVLLEKITERAIVKKLSGEKSLKVLDAGAGTGRWSFILHKLFKKNNLRAYFDLIDITPEMLKEAEKKILKAGLEEMMKPRVGNIEKLPDTGPYDLAISFYNVLSFVENPGIALKQVSKKLKKGGIYASVVANKYHSYFFSILTNQVSNLEVINKKSKTRFTADMPYIHCFTPASIKDLYLRSGFKKVEIIGFPNFVYPNIEETKIIGQSERNKSILENKKSFNKIVEIELKECFGEHMAARGNALLVIGRK